jgi:hypothetical protein
VLSDFISSCWVTAETPVPRSISHLNGIYLQLLHSCLFNDAVNTLEYAALNVRLVDNNGLGIVCKKAAMT